MGGAIQTVFWMPECDTKGRPDCIVFHWRNMPHSELFLIRLADRDDAWIVKEEAEEAQFKIDVDEGTIEPDN